MEIQSNLETVIKRLKTLAENSEGIDFSQALLVGVNAALGQMKNRVFNTGKDAKGIAFGKYVGKRSRATNRRFKTLKYGLDEDNKATKKAQKRFNKNSTAGQAYTEYEKERLSQGRQVQYKDLEFTGSLRRGIVVVIDDETKVSAVIPNPTLLKIAQGQQVQLTRITGQEINIFGLSDEERELLQTNTNEALKQLYARLFNS